MIGDIEAWQLKNVANTPPLLWYQKVPACDQQLTRAITLKGVVTGLRCYLVRNTVGLGVLGLFWAESSERLWWLIDQANADPSQYEYAELADGFLAFTEDEPVADQVAGADHEGGRPGQFEWSGAEPSEALQLALHEQSQMIWRKLPAADEPGGGLYQMGRGRSAGGPGSGR